MTAVDQHVEWIGDCLETMGERGATRIEPEVAVKGYEGFALA